MIGLLLAASFAAAHDPCATVEPLATRDPVVAAAYREVAASELAAGARDAVVAGYRAALASDPSDAIARESLRKLCAEAAPADPFQDGVRRMERGDLRGAIERFQQVRRDGPDPSSALLEGVCRYELGDDAGARRLLREAEAAPAHRELARFHLGLVELRSGSPTEAASLLEAASGNAAIGREAARLARAARTGSRLVVSLLALSGWDSNVNLAPSGDPGLAPASDGAYTLAGSVLIRPAGVSGPYLRAGGLWQQQLELDAYDVAGVDAAAGWQLGRDARGVAAEYGYTYRTLGGEDFLSAHRALASAWFLARGTIWSATYLARLEDYPGVWSEYSGTLHRGEVRAARPLGRRFHVALAYGLGHDDADARALTWTEHGPRAALRIALSRRLRLGLDAAVSLRRYAAYDPALEATRRDTYLDGGVTAEWDLGRGFTARGSLEGRKAFSSVPALEYARIVPMLGLGYVIGF